MARLRKRFQGVAQIVRFNWHFFVLATAGIILLLLIRPYLGHLWHGATLLLVVALILSIVVSLCVSYYIYDVSNLYTLDWLDDLQLESGSAAANIHAGFDETSVLLTHKFPNTTWSVFDFYDPKKHTEVSIKRARKAFPAFPGTQAIASTNVPLATHSTQAVFLIFAAHEIREADERVLFFRELHRVMKEDGELILTEHLRDVPNFLAYSIGFGHFMSRSTWMKTAAQAGFTLVREQKITPFVTTFRFKKNGIAA